MTDPMDALSGLQTALLAGVVRLSPCELSDDIHVLLDHPNGRPRFTFARMAGSQVQAIALFVLTEPVEGLPCFQVGYAVIESMRGKGLGSNSLQQGIEELRQGLSRTPMKEFFLEAVVSADNEPSKKIAERLISSRPESCIDIHSGVPAYQYLRRIACIK